MKAFSGFIIFGLVIIALIGLKAFAVVQPGYRGVYVLFGEADEKPVSEGAHWINPMANIISMDVKQRLYEEKRSDASSKDLQSIFTSVAVNYKLNPAKVVEVYTNISQDPLDWERIIIKPSIEESLKSVTALFTAEELIHKREEAKVAITKKISERLSLEHVTVVAVSITDFAFNKKFSDSIESKQIAEQRALQANHELEQIRIESQKLVVEAEAKKTAYLTEAQAKAEALKMITDAESRYHSELQKVVNKETLKLKYLEKWDGVLPKVSDGSMELILSDKLINN